MIDLRLTPAEVDRIFFDSVFRDDEEIVNPVDVDGVNPDFKIGFQPDRLWSHLREVRVLLAQLPEEFYGDGGSSFHSALATRNRELWTTDINDVEKLFMLGLALCEVECPWPRSLWGILPGGAPYYKVVNW